MRKEMGENDRALFVDFDFHSGAVGFRLRLRERGNLAHALAGVSHLDDHWFNYPAQWNDLDVLPAPVSDAEIRKGALLNVEALFNCFKAHYPVTAVDMPTAFYSSCRDIATLADLTVQFCTPQVLSLHLAKRRLSDMFGSGVRPEAMQIILNRADATAPVEVDYVQEVLEVKVIGRRPNDYQAVNNAYLMGGLVSETSDLGAALSGLSRYLLDL